MSHQPRVVPAELSEANAFVALHHRHHQPVVGHRFSLALVDEGGRVVGVLIAGRPVSRGSGSPRQVLEVTRLATDGTRNACSTLYAAAARAARAMGYERIQTYTLPEEGGASLRASGWENEGLAGGRQWRHADGKPRRTDQPTSVKTRWSRRLNPPADAVAFPAGDADSEQLMLVEVYA